MKSRVANNETRPGGAADPIGLEAHPEGSVLPIHLQPGSRRAGIVGRHGTALKVAVTAAPEKGKANRALLDLLHKQLGVKRAALEIISGHTSRDKRVLLRGIDSRTLQERLGTAQRD